MVEIRYVGNNTIKSTPKEVSKGHPLGTVLGPALFILFTIDLPLQLSNMCSCLVYADDPAFIVSDNTTEGLEKRV